MRLTHRPPDRSAGTHICSQPRYSHRQESQPLPEDLERAEIRDLSSHWHWRSTSQAPRFLTHSHRATTNISNGQLHVKSRATEHPVMTIRAGITRCHCSQSSPACRKPASRRCPSGSASSACLRSGPRQAGCRHSVWQSPCQPFVREMDRSWIDIDPARLEVQHPTARKGQSVHTVVNTSSSGSLTLAIRTKNPVSSMISFP